MRIFQVLPIGMRFEKRHSTSVELCVSEWVSGSRFRDATTIVAAESEAEPLTDIAVERLSDIRRPRSWWAAWAVRRAASRRGCDLIVFQQHVASAARMAAVNPRVPVILQTHNFVDGRARGRFATLKNALARRRLRALGGITLVSRATLRHFEEQWPEVTIPRAVVSNGFDFSAWTPSAIREPVIVVVGRCEPYKGLVEAAGGVARFLAGAPDWRAVFVLSEPDRNPGYAAAIKAALAPCGDRAAIWAGVPFSEVRALTERAAIAIVASTWNEPFGRTALEAHAGGAALISSGTGGLREISGEDALFLDAVTPDAIAGAIAALAADPARREALATAAGRRVRRLFSLEGDGEVDGDGVRPISRRLDDFYEDVVAAWRIRRPGG